MNHKTNLFTIVTALMFFSLSLASSFQISKWDYVEQDINGSTLNVNNSQFLEGHPSSYFYPFSNPLNFINTTPDLSGLIPKAYGVSSSSASTNSKSVTIAGYTPVAGDIIAIKFTYGSTTTQKWNLLLNGVLYNVLVGGSTVTADYLLFSANAVVLLYYDGTKMDVVNPTYTNPLKWITLAGTNERPVETIYGYKLAWKDGNNRFRPIIKTSGTTGNNDMPNTAGFRLGSNMVINSGGTTYGTSSFMAKDFNLIGDIGTTYNFNSGFTAWLPVYFKGTVNQTDGLFYFNQANGYTGWYTQTLPTSEDGFVYVYVGNAWTAYGIGLSLNHPAYEFKDGMIRLYGEAKNTHQDNFKEYFGTGNNFSIFSDGTNLVFNTSESGSGLAYFSNNVSADYFIGDGSQLTGLPQPNLSGYIPYTGATNNVNLNGKNITNLTYIDRPQMINMSKGNGKIYFEQKTGINNGYIKGSGGNKQGLYLGYTTSGTEYNALSFTGSQNYITQRTSFDYNSTTGATTTAASALVHIGPSNGATGYAPLKFTTGPLTANGAPGQMEYNGSAYYLTDNTSTRRVIALSDTVNIYNFSKDLHTWGDNIKHYFGNSDASIYYDGTNLVFNTSESGSGLAYFSDNVSATGFITRTSVYDKSKGTALDNIKDVKELTYKDSKGKEQINHSAFYGYTKFNTTDLSKPVKEKITEEICNEIEDEKTDELIITCENITKEVTTYPHKKLEEGVDLGMEIDVLRQAVYELKMELEKVKSETCTIKLFSWCIK